MAEILEKNKMVMKYYVGEATGDNEEKYELSIGIGNSAPIIKLPSGETVMFNWDELINLAINEKKRPTKDSSPSQSVSKNYLNKVYHRKWE